MTRIAIAVLLCAACHSATRPPVQVFQKGQLHVHSNHSGDSQTPPEAVARWYAARGYDFIVMTDHNIITSLDGTGELLVIPGVELTQNLEICEPPPLPGMSCLLHVNALFVTPPDDPALRWHPVSPRRADLYLDALAATRRLGGIAQLNHPNFHWAADAALIARLVKDGDLHLFEVANQSSDVNNDGDTAHPSTEQLWDAVLATGAHLFGTATDDAHAYDDADAIRARGGTPDTGDHGWVMVRAAGHDRAAIREALARGDFYATTGVVLRRLDHTSQSLDFELDDEAEIICIANGRQVSRIHGRSGRCAIPRGGYVRATATDGAGRRAWIQPVWSN